MALQLSEDRLSMLERRNQIIEGLHALPSQIKTVLEGDRSLRELASGVLANQRSLLIMGRGYQYVFLGFEAGHRALIQLHVGMPLVWRVLLRSRKYPTCTPRAFLLEN